MNKYDLFEELLDQYDNGTLDMFLESLTESGLLNSQLYEINDEIIDELSNLTEDVLNEEDAQCTDILYTIGALINEDLSKSEEKLANKSAINDRKNMVSTANDTIVNARKMANVGISRMNKEYKKIGSIGNRIKARLQGRRERKQEIQDLKNKRRDDIRKIMQDPNATNVSASERNKYFKDNAKRINSEYRQKINAAKANKAKYRGAQHIADNKEQYKNDHAAELQNIRDTRDSTVKKAYDDFSKKRTELAGKTGGMDALVKYKKNGDVRDVATDAFEKSENRQNKKMKKVVWEDYDLYKILDFNGYKPTNENLAILKQCLESGTAVILSADNISINEDMSDEYIYSQLLESNDYEISDYNIKTLSEAFVNNQILLEADSADDDDEKVIGLKKKTLKRIGKSLLGAAVGGAVGYATGAGASALSSKISSDAADKNVSDATAKEADASQKLSDAEKNKDAAKQSGDIDKYHEAASKYDEAKKSHEDAVANKTAAEKAKTDRDTINKSQDKYIKGISTAVGTVAGATAGALVKKKKKKKNKDDEKDENVKTPQAQQSSNSSDSKSASDTK